MNEDKVTASLDKSHRESKKYRMTMVGLLVGATVALAFLVALVRISEHHPVEWFGAAAFAAGLIVSVVAPVMAYGGFTSAMEKSVRVAALNAAHGDRP
jgi:formate/nitrite transporter FocA (FNT family)